MSPYYVHTRTHTHITHSSHIFTVYEISRAENIRYLALSFSQLQLTPGTRSIPTRAVPTTASAPPK